MATATMSQVIMTATVENMEGLILLQHGDMAREKVRN
jgi:hypothetical protein